MKRRNFLVGVGSTGIVGLSGYINGITDASGPNTNGSGESPMHLSLTDVDDAPEPSSFEVTVSNDQLSTTELPIVEIAVKNTGDETVSWSYGGGVSNLPFPQGVHDSATGGVILGLEEEVRAQLMDVSSGCARVDQFTQADAIKNTTLEANTQVKRSYAIAGVAGELSGNCPPSGEYRMEYELGDFGMVGFEFKLEQ